VFANVLYMMLVFQPGLHMTRLTCKHFVGMLLLLLLLLFVARQVL
jgi:hypothetical protein